MYKITKIPGVCIDLDWHDGPLLSAQRVECVKTTSEGVTTLEDLHIRVITPQYSLEGDFPKRSDRPNPFKHPVVVSFRRDDLLKFLDIIDGKPVEDYQGEMKNPLTIDES